MTHFQVNPWQNVPNLSQENQNNNQSPWWSGANISGYADALGSLYGSIKGNPQGPDSINNYYQLPPEEKSDEEKEESSFLKNAMIGLIAVVVIIGGIIIYRTSNS